MYPQVKTQAEPLGHQAPKGRRINNIFASISVEDMHYCVSHNFWFNRDEHNKMLHYAMPCMYTDYRYVGGQGNFYGEGYMIKLGRRYVMSLKEAMRKLRKTRNLPVGTIATIGSNFYGIGKKSGKSFSYSYKYKVKIENKFDPQFEISPEFNAENFTTDQKAKELTDLLRANGFIVKVNSKNTNFLSNMIATAAAYKGGHYEPDDEEGEMATAYGHGLRIGYSSNDSTYQGYSYGIKNILFEKWDHFNKWSQCHEISKEKSNEEILKILLEAGNKFEDDNEE